jgi:coenzyme F420 hydrogenase subunit beta
VTRTGSPTVARVLAGQLCTGCGLCAGVADTAITMETIAPGYSRPLQRGDVSAQAEALIARSCPGATVAPWQAAPHRHPYWGPYHRVLTSHATDDRVRHAGSSGGAITALALHALRTGMVDRVVHVVADPEHPTRNLTTVSNTAEAVLAGAGSRYAASSPLVEIDRLLTDGGKLAFIGKPCDVSALRQLATVDSRVDAIVPVMLAFFCAGLPSHAGADRIIRDMGLEPEEVVSFRYRGNGWPGLTRAETADGRFGEMRYADSWGGHLSREVQFRCKICPDAVGGVADVAAADAWYGGDSGYPQFEEQDGRSLTLTRTIQGEALLDAAVAAGDMAITPLAIGEIDLMQPAQARRKRAVAARLAACAATLQPRPRMQGLDILNAARLGSFKEAASNMAGTARRIVQGRR